MRLFRTLAPLVLFSGLVIGCNRSQEHVSADSTAQAASVTAPATGVTTATISVPTTVCESCEKTITAAVRTVDGVTACTVDAKAHVAKVEFTPTKTNLSAIEHAIAKAGYTANGVERDSAAYAGLEECCKK